MKDNGDGNEFNEDIKKQTPDETKNQKNEKKDNGDNDGNELNEEIKKHIKKLTPVKRKKNQINVLDSKEEQKLKTPLKKLNNKEILGNVEEDIYMHLPNTIISNDNKGDDNIYPFVMKYIGGKPSSKAIYKQKVAGQKIALDNPPSLVKEKKKKRRTMPARKRKENGVYDIPEMSFETFLPLNILWKQYMNDLTGNISEKDIYNKLIKADFHGCIFTVIRAKNPSFIGITGIAVQETMKIF